MARWPCSSACKPTNALHTLQAESALIQAAQQPLDDLLVLRQPGQRASRSARTGRTLAVGDDSGHVGLWDVATGRRTATLTEGSPVYGVAFSPDGRDPGRRRPRRPCRLVGRGDRAAGPPPWPKAAAVYGVAFSPDGQTLAVGDNGGHVGLWDVATGRRTATLAEGSPVDAVAFSPDGQTLAVGDSGGRVGLWDVATGQKTAILAEGQPGLRRRVQPGRARPWPSATTAAVSACGTWRPGTKTATLAEGSPVTSRRVQPGRADPGRRRRRRSCRLVGRGDRAEDRHPGRGQPGLRCRVQPGRADPGRRRRRRSCRLVGRGDRARGLPT